LVEDTVSLSSPAVDRNAAVPPPKALRIALVTETYPPEVNGVAATIARVVQGCVQRGHHVQLVRPRQQGDGAPQSTPALSEVLMRSLPLLHYPGLRMGLPCTSSLVALWKQHRPDVVHVVTEGPLGWSALRAARALGLPVVSDYRTNFDAYSGHYGLGWLRRPVMAWLRHFHNRTACTMVPTDVLRSSLLSQGFRNVRVVARGVDTRQFDPARRSATLRAAWGAGEGTTVALCVGRLAPEKNLDAVLAAVEAMRRDEPGLRLVLVGDGPERARLQQHGGDVIFAGIQRGDALAAHYASADVFLFASTTETYGNVVPEAMASGLAVVAFDDAAAGQLVRHGRNGLLARVGDLGGYCALARRLADELPQSRELGRQARLTAQRLDWAGIVAAIDAEYRAAIEGRDLVAPLPAGLSAPAPAWAAGRGRDATAGWKPRPPPPPAQP